MVAPNNGASIANDTAKTTDLTNPAKNTAKVSITIDGKQTTVAANMSIADAARSLGIEIPTLCYLRNINEIGSCRVCVVEVEGANQLVASCNNYAQDGMVVFTNSPKVRSARKTNVELLLSNHNVQCTNCIRNANCRLQEVATNLNIIGERYEKHFTSQPWNSEFPLIRDNDKCIRCMRCIQICDKIQASSIWDLKDHATRTTVGVANNVLIEVSDCAICGQCITHCPTAALRERDDTEQALEALADKEKICIVQIAPSVRTAWGEELGIAHKDATIKRLVSALRQMGFDYVIDTNFAADLTIMEEGAELVERFGHHDKHPWPMFTSCCPGWVRWLKAHHPDLTDNLSTAKSPIQMLGAVVKTYYAEVLGVDPERICSIAVTPCLAKKSESAIPSINDAKAGQDIDISLTTREIARMIKAEHINPQVLEESEFDRPISTASGAGEIFGVSGGVMEAALRTGAYLITGKNPDPHHFDKILGFDGWKEAEFDLDGTVLKVAVASGLGNASKLIDAIKAGEVSYDFVEVMCCPGGCIGGGGQPIHENLGFSQLRAAQLRRFDDEAKYRFSHENPDIINIYENFFVEPLSERAEQLLHTDHCAWLMPGQMR
ncbi:hydrogenase [Actinomycetota bacterium]|nr:hydrogenase [Actinomycetota bacterium]